MGFYTNSTNIKNTELKSLAVSLDETVRNGGTFNEHLSCDAECEKTNCLLLKGQLQLVGPDWLNRMVLPTYCWSVCMQIGYNMKIV